MIIQARVMLKGAKTYKFLGRKFIQNDPKIIAGNEEEISKYKDNGFFAVTILGTEKARKPKKVEAEKVQIELEQDPAPKSKNALKRR